MATFAKSLLSRLPLPQVRASIVRAVLAMGEAKGVARAELLHATGLTEEDVAELDQVVPGVLVLRLYAFLQDRFPQDALGLDAAAIAPSSTFGVLGYALRNAPTLGDGLDMTRRFISLTSSHARMDREDTEDAVAITFRHHPLAIHARHPLELGLAFALRALGVERSGNKHLPGSPTRSCLRHGLDLARITRGGGHGARGTFKFARDGRKAKQRAMGRAVFAMHIRPREPRTRST